MSTIRPVFYVSDGTGITAETIGHSLLTQFSGFSFITDRMSFVDDPEKAREACARILRDCLAGLGQSFPNIGRLASAPRFNDCAAECVGLDGRAIRKMLANALASSPQTALDPDRVTVEDLLAAAKAAKANRTQGGRPK